MPELLIPLNGPKYVNAGESAKWSCTFSDLNSETLDADAITAITLTLKDESGNVVNSRSSQTVRNANGGTLAASGAFALILSPLDNAYQSATGFRERRYGEVSWDWTDENEATQTGKTDFAYDVQKLPV